MIEFNYEILEKYYNECLKGKAYPDVVFELIKKDKE